MLNKLIINKCMTVHSKDLWRSNIIADGWFSPLEYHNIQLEGKGKRIEILTGRNFRSRNNNSSVTSNHNTIAISPNVTSRQNITPMKFKENGRSKAF